MADSSLLVQIGMQYVSECIESSPSLNSDSIMKEIENYINGQISYQECANKSIEILKTSAPIEKLREILEISPEPIPSVDEGPDSQEDNSRKRTKPWTKYEDQRLIAGVHRFGNDSWALVSNFIGNNRTRAQCSQRWNRGLDPKISKEQWSYEDDLVLLRLVSIYGERGWTHIAAGMGNRSDVQCRYHYKQLKKDSNSTQFSLNSPKDIVINPISPVAHSNQAFPSYPVAYHPEVHNKKIVSKSQEPQISSKDSVTSITEKKEENSNKSTFSLPDIDASLFTVS